MAKWGSPESRLAYDRIIAEYLATRRVRDPESPPAKAPPAEPTTVTIEPGVSGGKVTPAAGVAGDIDDRISSDLTVWEISLRYLEYCDTYYRTPSGERTSTYGNALQAARALQLSAAASATPQRPHMAGLSEGESLT